MIESGNWDARRISQLLCGCSTEAIAVIPKLISVFHSLYFVWSLLTDAIRELYALAGVSLFCATRHYVALDVQ